ncbi:MAG: hypothetical protein H6660_00860 [Ardenticatenaceae bacterium]|nr:hypothetical protein [Ardenticatenaceae bacterium]
MAMRNWVVIGCLLVLLLAACQGESVDEVGETCNEGVETAVSLTLRDENDSPMQHVNVRYRVAGGAWQDLPERVNGAAVISGTAGEYEIVAQKQGYQTVETAVSVPAAPDGCGLTPQQLTLDFTRTACAVTPQPLALSLAAPADLTDLQVWSYSPTQGRQSLTCTNDANGRCAYLLPLTESGTYELTVEGLPGNGRMSLDDDIITVTYTPFDLLLTQGMREQHVNGEGVDNVTISVPVRPDEINCPLAALNELTVTANERYGDGITVGLLGGLTATDLGAAECQVESQLMPVHYNVTVPTGTRLTDIAVLYWLGEEWQTADCQFTDGQILCTAMLPNPLLKHPYAVKAVVNGVEHIGTQVPFDNMCFLFPSP